MFASFDHYFRLLQHPQDKRLAIAHALREFVLRIQCRIDRAAELRLRRQQRFQQLGIRRQRSDDHQIDIARGMLGAFGQGAVDKRHLDEWPQGRQRGAQHIDDAESFQDNAAQLFKDGRVAVGLVVFLIADPVHRDQAGDFQPCQLPLDGAGTRLREPDELISVKRALRLTEQHSQHPLLCFCKKCICISTHIEHGSTQYRHCQTQNGLVCRPQGFTLENG